MHRRRHRWSHALRSLLLVACALGLAVQPMLASLGELHELTAHVAAAPGAADRVESTAVAHVHDADGTRDDRSTGIGATAEALHTLLHFAHCCGHTPALGVPSLQIAKVMLPDGALPSQALSRPPTGRAITPFRPPITA